MFQPFADRFLRIGVARLELGLLVDVLQSHGLDMAICFSYYDALMDATATTLTGKLIIH